MVVLIFILISIGVISAREMARLQTFPDSFVFEGSMKKAMWQIGNAVPPLLAKNIGYALIPYFKQDYCQSRNKSRSILLVVFLN